jgi:hypothetical protein
VPRTDECRLRLARPEEEITNPLTLSAASSQPSPITVPPGAPNPANSPLGRYLLHPGQETSHVVHHLLRVLGDIAHVALPIVIAVVATVAAWKLTQLVRRLRKPGVGHLVEVRLPATVDPKASLALWRGLHSAVSARRRCLAPTPHVAFEMEGSSWGIGLRLWVPPEVSTAAVVRAVESACPGSLCDIRAAASPVVMGSARVCGEMRLAHPAWRSICTDHAADPLRSVLGALGSGNERERVLVQVLVRPARSGLARSLVRTVRSLSSGKPTGLLPRLIAAWSTTPTTPARPDPFRAVEVRHAVEKLSDLPLFEVAVRLGISGDGGDRDGRRRLRSHARQVSAAFGVYARDNHFVSRRPLGCPGGWSTACSVAVSCWVSRRWRHSPICLMERRSPGWPTPAQHRSPRHPAS